MASHSWSRWLRPSPRTQAKKSRKGRRPLSVERLEDRTTPTTFTWTGLGDGKWSNPANWAGGAAPTGLAANSEDLVFPHIGANAQHGGTNDLPLVGTSPPVFHSISISAGNALPPSDPSYEAPYTLSGKPIQLGDPSLSNSGNVIVQQNVTATIATNIVLGGAAGARQFFTVNNAGSLTINGHMSGNTGSSLVKEGAGDLLLANDNSGLSDAIELDSNGGTVTIGNAFSLGDASNGTVVGSNAQIRVMNVKGTILEPLILNGPGPKNDGALLNFAGNNTWAGNIQLDTNGPTVILGSAAGSLNISGQISDLGAGQNITKEGVGEIVFSNANTYRGTTTINNGTLTIENPLALGEPLPGGATPSLANGTVVNQSISEVGTLKLLDPSGVGFTVKDEILTLNGGGFDPLGALVNQQGNNTWAGPVMLGSAANGSSVTMGAAAGSTLTISGSISSPFGNFSLTKTGAGKVILNNADSYTGGTTVAQGALNIRDSGALGGGAVLVQNGAALELEVDRGFDAHSRDLSIDSVTGQTGNGPQLGLTVANNITLIGTGIGGTGALHSISGINRWTGKVTLQTIDPGTPPQLISPAIGVDADPNASNINDYFTHDYSLTITGTLKDGDIIPPLNYVTPGNLIKVDPGQLILPGANTYTGWTDIRGGWVTIQNNFSLGGYIAGGDTIQPTVTVEPGAALHLKPLTAGASLNIVKNMVLGGTGINHPFALINHKGALESLGGINTIGGPVDLGLGLGIRSSDIQLNGVTGIGVEMPDPTTPTGPSELTLTASISDFGGSSGGLTKYGSRRLDLQGDGSYSGPVSIAEGVLRTQHNSALGIATSGTFSSNGTDVYTNTTTTVGVGIAELQSLTISGASGKFTLTFGPYTTGQLDTASPTLASDIRTALNNLPNIGGVNGSVSVTQVGNVFTILFGGTLLGFNQPQLISNPVNPATTILTATLMDGDGAALELQNGNPLNNGGLSTGVSIWNDRLILNGHGNTQFGDAPVTALSDDNQWRGPVSLNVSSMIQVRPNGRLTLFGPIDDAANASSGGSSLTVTGGGELTLSGSNTFRGTTFVNQGVLLLANSQALGGGGVAEMQTLTLGSGAGSFQLTFNGAQTGAFDANSPTLASDVQNALNQLPTIQGAGGVVTVSQAGNVLTVTFGGNLAGFDQSQLVSSSASVTPSTLVDGHGGTVVANGSAIELQGSLTVAGEPLILQGKGVSTDSQLPVGWLPEGPAPINNGQNPGNQAVSGRVNSVAVDPTDPNVIYIATGGGGAWKTKDGGHTWLPLFDALPLQQLYVPSTTGQITLAFNGQTTQALNLASSTLAADIQNALNNLPTIGGLTPVPGNVTVTQSKTNPLVYYIRFGGALSTMQQPLLVGSGVGTTSNPTVTGVNPTMDVGAVAVDPNDPRIIYIGTGEANNASDSFYGTGVYRSLDSGKTWTLLTMSDGTNPLYGLAITKIVVDPGAPASSPWVQPQITYPAGETFNTPTGRIFVSTSNEVVHAPPALDASTPKGIVGVYRYDDATAQVQTLTVPTLTGGGTFTLSFTYVDPNNPGNPITATTGPLSVNSPTLAQDIQSALNSTTFSSIGGLQPIAGNVTVTQSPVNPLVFYIAFEGALLNQPEPDPGPPPTWPQDGTNYSTVTSLPFGPRLLVASGSGITNPVVSRGSTWVNLTATATTPRLTLNGQLNAPPNSVGPNDDFLYRFPENFNQPNGGPTATARITWSDLTLVYMDNTNPVTGKAPSPGFTQPDGTPIPGQGVLIPSAGSPRPAVHSIPVLYAALGTLNGSLFNAVYRTENPLLAAWYNPWGTGGGGAWTPDPSNVPTTWYVGDPGVPHNEIQEIDINNWQSNGWFQLGFKNVYTPFPPDPGTLHGADPASAIQSALNNLSTIGGVGGSVTVVEEFGKDTGNDHYFLVTFGGAMAFTQEPLITSITPNNNAGPPKVTISEVQAGSGVDTRSGVFPAGDFTTGIVRNGDIKVTSFVVPNPLLNTYPTLNLQPTFDQVTLYAAISYPNDPIDYPTTYLQLREVLKSVNGGKSWAAVSTNPSDYQTPHQGPYDTAILALSPTTVYVGGQEVDSTTHQGQIFVTTDGGTGWADVSHDNLPNGPHTSQHDLATDSLGRVLAANDGGLWRYDPTTKTWTDLNGNLAIAQLNSVAAPSTDLTIAFAGSRFNGTEEFTNGLAWTQVNPGDGGDVQVDPKNARNVYAIQGDTTLNGGTATLMRSTQGGAANTWTPILTGSGHYFPFLVDSINPSRLLAGGDRVQESLDQGNTWVQLAPTLTFNPTAIAAATYQGPFNGDPDFPAVTDKGTNTYDPDTIYITDGTKILVTKDHGLHWVNRGSFGSVADIEVDPTNRDNVYLVRDTFGGSKVFKSTNAGLSWTDLTGNLPNLPVWTVALDPRSGDVYVGTDQGVWELPGGTGSWQRFGTGLANTQVRDLEINLTTNTLLVGTYGRSMYSLTLNDVKANAGALRAVSGSSVWAGPVLLVGDPVGNVVQVGASGTQALQNGLAAAQLNIVGTISDLTQGGNARLVKVGQGDVILSGANTYGGVTEVKEGALVVHNPDALGSPSANTVVDAGTALELESDLELEPITLNGDGILFNGHDTGALRNVSDNNTYTGTLTLNTDATIGVDSGSSLTIGAKAGLGGTGTVIGAHNLTKELTGTLILASTNSYGGGAFSIPTDGAAVFAGGTAVAQGVVNVQNPGALGAPGNTTTVLDGAQLQLQGGVTVSNETLHLSGTGINATGALENVSGANVWNGPIFLALDPGFAPATTPPTSVAIGALGNGGPDTLTINGVIGRGGPPGMGLVKVGPGTVILTNSNTYDGLTTVAQGVLNVQNAGALGTFGTVDSGTTVISGATLELQSATALAMPNEFLTLNGTGVNNEGALHNAVGNNAWGGPITLQTNTSIGVAPSTLLTVTGSVQDPTPLPVPAASLTKAGTGTLVLPGSNSYSGKTIVAEGILNVQNNLALGNSGPEVQTITVLGASGTFTLTFGGQTTPSLDIKSPTLRLDIQNALNALSSIGGVGGSVAVTQSANVYTVTFGDALAFSNLPPIVSTAQPGVTALVTTVRDGPEGTVVNSGATLQVQGGLNVAHEGLTLNGAGFLGAGALQDLADNATWAGPITLGSNATADVGAFETQTVTVNGNSGTFTLTFNGQTTPALDASSATLAADMQLQLNRLSSVVGANGTAIVTQNGNVFTVVFGGNLGGADQPQMSAATVSGPVTVTVNTSTNGIGLGKTLSLTGPIDDAGKGFGLTNSGPAALLLGGTAPNTYTGLTQATQGLVVLDKTATSEVQAVNINGTSGTFRVTFNGQTTGNLAFNVPASGGVGPTASLQNALQALSTIGAGNVSVTLTSTSRGPVYLVTFTGTLANANQPQMTATGSGGATAVVSTMTDGNVGPSAFGGDLTAAGSPLQIAQVIWLSNNEVPDTSTVTSANQYSALNLNGFSDKLGTLHVVDSGVLAPGGSQLTVGHLDLQAGGVNVASPTSALILAGDVTATSDSFTVNTLVAPTTVTQISTIGGPGTMSLGGATRTFTVTAGPAPGDLTVLVPVTGTAGEGLVKDGNGGMGLEKTNTYTGLTTVKAGLLHVDGTISDVSLNGGTLDGAGTVGTISGQPPAGAPANGTVSPGAGGTSGILHSGDVTWGANSTFQVDLSDPSNSLTPTPGTDFNQLLVNGNVTLGGANLASSFTGSIPINAKFTILQVTGAGHTISGTFAQGNAVFLGGNKFSIDYSDPTKVVVTRVLADTSMKLDLLTLPASYGQPLSAVATVTPETGAPPIPSTDTVTFTLDSNPGVTVHADPDGKFRFDPQAGAKPLGVGPHTIVAHFDGDAQLFNANSTSVPFTVSKAPTSLSVPLPSPVYGDTVTLTANFSPALSSLVPGSVAPSQQLTFTVDPNTSNAQTQLVSIGSNSQASASFPGLDTGTHHFSVSYPNTDPNYASASTSGFFIVTAGNVTVTASANPSPDSYGNPVTLKATVTPVGTWSGMVTPSGTVKFYDGAIQDSDLLGSTTLDSGGVATLPNVTGLHAGTHTINVSYNGNGHYNGNTGSTSLTVNPDATSTALTSSANPSAIGQSVTFTATVSNISVTPGGPTPIGSVTFTIDSGTPTAPVALDANGQAKYTPPTPLASGSHTVVANYSPGTSSAGTVDFGGSTSSTLTQNVIKPSQVSISPSQASGTVTYPNTIDFTVTVAAGSGFSGTPGGTVTLQIDNGTPSSPQTLSGGQFTFTGVQLPGGSHTVTANYSGDANFVPQKGSISYTVNAAATTTAITASKSTSNFGDPVDFTATVSAVNSAAGTPTGTVTFVIDNVNQTPDVSLSGGTAKLTRSDLAGGTHTISAVYHPDNGNFATSNANSQPATLTVNAINTTSTIQSSGSPSTYGQAVTFTATVTSSAGPASGSGTFIIDGTSQPNSVNLDPNGHATLVTSTLAPGSHTVSFHYAGNSSFNPSDPATPATQVVNTGTTTTVVSSQNPSTFGQSVTFTATVSSPAGAAPGSVTFIVDNVNQSPTALNGSGQATLTLSNLTPGPHTIGASYAGTTNYGPSSASPLTQTVNRIGTSTALASSANPSPYGQPVTFTATVTAPGATPTGTVTFVIDGVSQSPVQLSGSGTATFTLTNAAPGQHTVSASYSGTATLAPSTSAPLTQVVTTTTTVTLTGPGPNNPGAPPVYTATVSSPGGTPTGTVTFVVDGVNRPPVPLNSAGQASIDLSNLPTGTHTLGVIYNGAPGFPASSLQQPLSVFVAGFRGTPNQVWVNQVYQDLLGRPADASGLAFWTDQLESDVSRQTVAQSILNSDEYKIRYIIHLFQTLLGRNPSAADVQPHLDFLRGGGTTLQLTANFLSSPEYFFRTSGGDLSAYVTHVFQDVLGRPADQRALQVWVPFLQSNSRFDFAMAVLQSAERDGNFVRQMLYEKLLGREPDSPQTSWVTALQQGATDEDVIAGVVSSDEYFMRLAPAHNNLAQEQAWIAQVYQDVLGKAIDPAGQTFWVNAQEHGMARLHITEMIVNSQVYRDRLITNVFQSLLGRAPSANDLSVYENYLLGGGTVDGMKAVIMGSAEYYFGHGHGTDAGFLNAAFQDVLHRPIDQGGLQFWGPKLGSEDRASLALEFLQTPDADLAEVQDLYAATLHRNADPVGQAYWAGQLQAGFRDEYVVAELVATPEYFNRFKS